MFRNSFRSFAPVSARGGMTVDASKTAVLCIEFQNEFATKGGKLNGAVASVMQANGMLDKTVDICAAARAVGAKVFHEAITFAEDASDNPNKGLGILAGCAGDKLFTAGTWNADYCDKMKPQEGDIIVDGKKGLDGFPARIWRNYSLQTRLRLWRSQVSSQTAASSLLCGRPVSFSLPIRSTTCRLLFG